MKAVAEPCFFCHEVKKTVVVLETLRMAADFFIICRINGHCFCVICWNLFLVLTQLYLIDCKLG